VTGAASRREGAGIFRRFVIAAAGAAIILAALSGTALAQAPAADDRQALEKQVQQLAQELADVQRTLSAMEEAQAARDAEALKSAAAAASVQTAPARAQQKSAPQAAATQQTPPAAPATRPGSTAPSTGSVAPSAVYNQNVGALQPTTAEQAHHGFPERKPGRDLTFYTHNGEITVYGNLDVSLDDATKGGRQIPLGSAPAPPVGNMGWLEDISTNLAYIGVRGTMATGLKDTNFIYQLETSLDISTAPGLHESNSQEQDTVDGTLFTRNSYIGLGKVKWGAILIGKTDPPYKQSTARMNPFSGMEGDYGVVMGNTGGDNRVEFGYRLDHSIWYASPGFNGYQFNVLFSPGQDRAGDSDNLPAGEPDCNGGDNPGDGGLTPIACNDGSFGDVWSANVSYTKEPLYITAAYERHMNVNRQSDMTGIYSGAPPSGYTGPVTTNDPGALPANYQGAVTVNTQGTAYFFWVPTAFYNADVADEDAGKIGIQYGFFQRKTIVSAIIEDMHRYLPGYLEWQNERQRLGSWLAVTQAVGNADSLSFGWARAYRTPGDPCQHNDCFENAPYSATADGNVTGGRGTDNESNLFTVAYRHRIGDGLEIYYDYAGTFNHTYAHFDLGAGGRGVTTDCHDASDATGGESSDPHCWAGGHLQAVSMGVEKRF
jgi:predicted porin